MDNLNQDVLERVLSWLPTSSFFRLTSVSKRWKSAADSASFKLACAAVPSRDPWFLMLPDPRLNRPSLVFDSAENNWKTLNNLDNHRNSMPVAASGGLVCFRDALGNFAISNPLTGSVTQVPPLDPALRSLPLHAIVMTKTSNKLALVLGEEPNLSFKLYDPKANLWEKETFLRKKHDRGSDEGDLGGENSAVYFLSKAGNVVSLSTEMQRSPCKQYSSVALAGSGGEERVCFVSSAGRVVECSPGGGWFREYPRLLPALHEYSLDVVECGGRLLVVLLSEFCESASLRVWRYDEGEGEWRKVATMPAAMSHEWYGKKADINCVGAGGERIMVCLSSAETGYNNGNGNGENGYGSSCVLCDVEKDKWTELPQCCVDGKVVDFVSAFSFEPRIEACV